MRAAVQDRIRRWRYEAALEISEEMRAMRGMEAWLQDVDAKRAWLAALDSCDLCHGTGVRMEPVRRAPEVLHESNGDLYRRGGMAVGDNWYSGYFRVTPQDLLPEAREVFCDHKAREGTDG